MRNVIIGIISIMLFIHSSNGQNVEIENKILNKAKWLTLSRFGNFEEKELEMKIQNQKSEIIKCNISDSILFIKIYRSQLYTLPNGGILYCGLGCFYIIGYNKVENKFYRLYGFETNNIDELIYDSRQLNTKLTYKKLEECLSITLEPKKKKKANYKDGSDCDKECRDGVKIY